MKRYSTTGIVLRRVDFAEADRVVTFITPIGKLAAMAKGVRRPKSKLAGGIELLSESELTFIGGKGSLETLVSARLRTHFGSIMTDYDRMTAAYEMLKATNQVSEDRAGEEFYPILLQGLQGLNNLEINLTVVVIWWQLQLLRALGQQPELLRDDQDQPLSAKSRYELNPATATLHPQSNGNFGADQIKAWRVLLTNNLAEVQNVRGIDSALADTVESARRLLSMNID
jgi:DNA repair protein RecO (recombination protein O)